MRKSESQHRLPNQRAPEDAAIPVLFHAGRQWRGASDPGRSAKTAAQV